MFGVWKFGGLQGVLEREDLMEMEGRLRDT
jgi:hypothetical protein